MAYPNIKIKPKVTEARLPRLVTQSNSRKANAMRDEVAGQLTQCLNILRPMINHPHYNELFDGQPIEVAVNALEDALDNTMGFDSYGDY